MTEQHKKHLESVTLILRQSEALDLGDDELPCCDGISCFECPALEKDSGGDCYVPTSWFRDWFYERVIEGKR